MLTPENALSVNAQHTLRDMVVSEMYLVAQSQHEPWPLLYRRLRKRGGADKPHTNLIESSVAMELVERGLVEATSNRTYVASKAGHLYYEQQMRRLSA